MAKMTTTQMLTGIRDWVLGKLSNITSLIPSQASAQNQLADKAFVNSSIATATATFRGTYNLVSDLGLTTQATRAQIAAALATKMAALFIVPDDNDYAFVQFPTSDATPTEIAKVERYKYNGSAWDFEFELNNSGFTAAQWAAINSGVSAGAWAEASDVPVDVMRTASDATLVNSDNDPLIYLRQASSSLAGLMTAAEHTKLGELPTASELYTSTIYDVSANNPTAGPNNDGKFTLEYILNNADTLISPERRHGGMTISFAHSIDNKYVQYRLIKNEWSTYINDWSFCGDDVLVSSNEFVEIHTDNEEKILYGVNKNGDFHFGGGIPSQITEVLNTKVDKIEGKQLSTEDFTTSEKDKLDALPTNTGLSVEFGNKVDKITGKSLINEGFAADVPDVISVEKNSMYMETTTDSDNKILEGITNDGRKEINIPIDMPSVTVESVNESKWLQLTIDSTGRVLGGRRIDGTVVENCDVEYPNGIPRAIKDYVNEQIPSEELLEITIPNTIYAVVGTELNLWNDAISLSSDRGLSSPMNYQVKWNCSKGLITDRCFRFNPEASDAGKSYSCTCTLYDIQWKVLSSKTFTIRVLAKNALNSEKKIVYFGDSLGASAAFKLYQDFNGEKFTGTIPTMLGTRGTACKYEAVGGYTWASYATTGPQGYRISVSGVTSLGVNSIYSDGSHVFEVAEVNLVDGIGNVLLLRYFTNPGELIMPSGTLTKVSGTGDDTIPYTDAFQESANPLWNDTTQQLDISQYKSMIGLQPTDKIDAVSFQFGINDHSLGDNLGLLMTYIDALYHCFVDDNPNCKFIIGLTTSAGNDFNGSGANYGASGLSFGYLKDTYNIRKFYLTLQNSVDYPNIRIAPISLELDRYYGYAFSERPISQRYTETEKYHNNYVHPGDSGYGQMGDAYFAAYIGALTEN